MKTFDWSRMSVFFPEWKYDTQENLPSLLENYNKIADFQNEKVRFSFKDDYCIELTLNEKFPSWAENPKEIRKMYDDLSQKVYDEVLTNLENSFNIIDNWRNFMKDERGIVNRPNNFPDFLQFYQGNQGQGMALYDEYKFYSSANEFYPNSPSRKLFLVGQLPKDSLNDKWLGYYMLSDIINENGQILGDDFSKCIENADEIYKIYDELKELKF